MLSSFKNWKQDREGKLEMGEYMKSISNRLFITGSTSIYPEGI